ncbi:hypothetical protein SBADM41S_09313 [Streptomyces badius]
MNRACTTSASRGTTRPDASVTPVNRSSATSSPVTSPSTTATPRAASCSYSSSVGSGPVWRKRVTSSLHCRHISAWCTASGPVASTPIGRSATSWPWQYGQCNTSRPQRSARPGTGGSSSTSPVVTSSRRASTLRPSSVTTRKPRSSPFPGSRWAEATRPSTISAPYPAASPRPIASSSPGGVDSRPR